MPWGQLVPFAATKTCGYAGEVAAFLPGAYLRLLTKTLRMRIRGLLPFYHAVLLHVIGSFALVPLLTDSAS